MTGYETQIMWMLIAFCVGLIYMLLLGWAFGVEGERRKWLEILRSGDHQYKILKASMGDIGAKRQIVQNFIDDNYDQIMPKRKG